MEHHQHHEHPKPEHASSHGAHAPEHYDHPVESHAHSGHDHSAMIADFLRRFWISLALTIPVVIISPMFQHAVGYEFNFPGRDWVSLILSSVIFIYGGKPFLQGLVQEIRRGEPGMMTLIGVAISVAYLYSVVVVLGLVEGMDFFWELATLIVIMLLGHWLEMKSVAGASRALELIVKMLPAEAHMYHGDMLHEMRVDELRPGDLVLVKPGEKVPVDGIVVEGESYVNESMLTGESVPVHKIPESKLIAGAVNGEGSLKVRVEKEGKDSYLNKVINLVREAQNAKSKNTAVGRSCRKVADIHCFRFGYSYADYLAHSGTGIVVCTGANGNGDGHFLSACPGCRYSAGSCHFHRDVRW
jgi:Cu2+-exporting ATPase